MVARYTLYDNKAKPLLYADNIYQILSDGIRLSSETGDKVSVCHSKSQKPIVTFVKLHDSIMTCIHVKDKDFDPTEIINLIDNWPIQR